MEGVIDVQYASLTSQDNINKVQTNRLKWSNDISFFQRCLFKHFRGSDSHQENSSASIVFVGFPKSQQLKPDFVLQPELEFSTS